MFLSSPYVDNTGVKGELFAVKTQQEVDFLLGLGGSKTLSETDTNMIVKMRELEVKKLH